MIDFNDTLNFVSGGFCGSICVVLLQALLTHLDAKDAKIENERLKGINKALLLENEHCRNQNEKLIRFIRERMCDHAEE